VRSSYEAFASTDCTLAVAAGLVEASGVAKAAGTAVREDARSERAPADAMRERAAAERPAVWNIFIFMPVFELTVNGAVPARGGTR